MSIVKTNLVTAFGDYYINEGQNMNRLLSALRTKSVTAGYAKPIIHDGEVFRFSNVILGEIVQGFQKAFTAKGDATFEPNEIRLRNAKVDVNLYPDDVKGSWLGFLGSLTDDERKNWPIVRYLMEQEVIPQIQEDMELKAYFTGSYVAPTPGTPGTAAGTMDGLKSILDAGIADASMQNNALSSAITEATAFEMVEEFVDNFEDKLATVPMRVYMDPKVLRWYHRDKRNTHGVDVNYNAEKPVVDFTNVELIGLPSMAGQKYIWATPNENFIHLRRVNGMKKPKVEEAQRNVSLMLDWWEGLGFGYNELVYVSTWI